MDTAQFLRAILPVKGWYYTASLNPSGNGFINTAHQTIDTMVEHANRLTFEGKVAFYALAGYKADRYWDAEYRNKAPAAPGKWRSRTQDNSEFMRSFFLDLDIGADDERKYISKDEALEALEAFRLELDFPEPTVVDSGGGLHVYWSFTEQVPVAQWRIAAEQLKDICLFKHFRADRVVTADSARVLRVPGGYNVRRQAPVKIVKEGAPSTFAALQQRILMYADGIGATSRRSIKHMATPTGMPAPPIEMDGLGDNLGVVNDPINLDRVAFHCAQIGRQMADRGATASEPTWRMALGIAKFSEPAKAAYAAVSDGHPDYDEHATVVKITNWRTGPTTCDHFHEDNPTVCEACPHYQKLTSPAQLGRMVREAAAPTVIAVDVVTGEEKLLTLPTPPEKYKRRASDGAVLFSTEDSEGAPTHEVICPNDLYPLSILRQSGADAAVAERSVWRAHLPRMGATDFDVDQTIFADGKKLHGLLSSKGIYLLPDQAKAVQVYMSAYLQKLAAEADREKIFDRLGWHSERHEFVLGDIVLAADGKTRRHQPGRAVRAATKEGVISGGTVSDWNSAMQFYNKKGMEGARMFLYASFGAPLFHMNDTGNKGVLMTASGESGRGKTTVLKACASVWGVPDALLMNGNSDGSTINALYESLGTFHSLPFMWDEITERDPEEIRRVLLNISQGAGKVRMQDGNGLATRRQQWETIVLASANTDDISRIMASGKDVQPHLMRLVGVEFGLVDTSANAKLAADAFIRAIGLNYGTAGPVFMKYVVANYAAVRKLYIANVAKVDQMLNSTNASAERFWSATVAAAYTGAQVAQHCGLLPGYPVQNDLTWMVSHIGQQRTKITNNKASALDLLSEFLESHVGHTLTLSTKQAGNLDNVVHKPQHQLLIRYELDSNVMYVSKTAVRYYASEVRTAFNAMENELANLGIIADRNAQKTLGADTPYAKGQTRCWKIDTTKLGPKTTLASGLPPNNVVPISGGKAA